VKVGLTRSGPERPQKTSLLVKLLWLVVLFVLVLLIAVLALR